MESEIIEGQQLTSMVICLSLRWEELWSFEQTGSEMIHHRNTKYFVSTSLMYVHCTRGQNLRSEMSLPVSDIVCFSSDLLLSELGRFEVIWQQVSNNLTGVRKSQPIKDERGGLLWRKLLDSTANRCQLLLNISYQLVLNSHLHSNRWHYPSCHSLFWVLNFSHLSHFGLLERVPQLSGKRQLSSKLHLQYCTMYSEHRWHLFPVSFPFYFFSSFVFQLPLFLRLS